ncbi:MAG: hypothetical protein RI932_724 [Pseudomonadota bacterium]
MTQEYKQLWRFYVDRVSSSSLAGRQIFLNEEESRLAAQVLRLREGEGVELADGFGWSARAVVSAVQKKTVEVEVQNDLHSPKSTLPRLAVVGLPKPGALDEVVQAAVDSGLDHLIFFRGERSTSKQEFKAEKIHRHVFELSRITKSPWNLAVDYCESLSAALEKALVVFQSSNPCFFVCDERPVHGDNLGPTPHLLEMLLRFPARSWACIVGPEASFGAHEYELLQQFKENHTLDFVSLGNRILRTPAAVAAATWMMAGCQEQKIYGTGSPNSAHTPK